MDSQNFQIVSIIFFFICHNKFAIIVPMTIVAVVALVAVVGVMVFVLHRNPNLFLDNLRSFRQLGQCLSRLREKKEKEKEKKNIEKKKKNTIDKIYIPVERMLQRASKEQRREKYLCKKKKKKIRK